MNKKNALHESSGERCSTATCGVPNAAEHSIRVNVTSNLNNRDVLNNKFINKLSHMLPAGRVLPVGGTIETNSLYSIRCYISAESIYIEFKPKSSSSYRSNQY